jgi:hypothetical protein
MTQRVITDDLQRRFDVIVDWQYPNVVYIEYAGDDEMPDWMYDELSFAVAEYGKVLYIDEQREGYGIEVEYATNFL